MKSELIIVCDDREPKIMDMIASTVGGVRFDRKRLLTGDYILGDVCIERKTINDFASSIIDGRLANQIEKMKSQFKFNYVLVSGSIKKRTSNIHEHCILGKMASIVVKYGVPIVSVDDDFQLVYLMKRIFEKHKEKNKKEKEKNK